MVDKEYCDGMNVRATKTNPSSRAVPERQGTSSVMYIGEILKYMCGPHKQAKKAARTESSTIAAAVVEATISRNGTPAQDALPQTRPLRIHSSHLHWPSYERCVSYAHVHDSRDSSLLHTHRILTHPFNYVAV